MYAPERTLWCGNLSPKVDEELLFELFLQAGPLEDVTIPKEKNGQSKGYGFVFFKHEASVIYAMELMKGVSLFGQRILPQQRVTIVDKGPNHRRSTSLQDHMMRNQPLRNMMANANVFRPPQMSMSQGFNIPVLGGVQGPCPYPFGGYPPCMPPMMGAPMYYNNNPMPVQLHYQQTQRRRTFHSGFPSHNRNFSNGGGGSYQQAQENSNIPVIVNNGGPNNPSYARPRSGNNHMPTEYASFGDGPLTIYSRRKLNKK